MKNILAMLLILAFIGAINAEAKGGSHSGHHSSSGKHHGWKHNQN